MSSSTPLVLVHGWGGSRRSWDALVWDADTRVIAHDLPGHGARTTHSPYGIWAAADDLIRQLEGIAEPVVLVGHSLGGQVTTIVQSLRPDLVAAECVINPAYGHPDADRERMQLWFDRVQAAPHHVIAQFVNASFGTHTPTASRDRIHTDLAQTPEAVLTDYLRDEYFADDSIGFASLSLPLLARRSRPTLAFYSGERAADFERSAGAADLVVWPGFGHYVHLEAPSAFVQTLTGWLDRRHPGHKV